MNFDLHSQCKRVTDNPHRKFNEVRHFKKRIKVYDKAQLEGVAKKSGNPHNFNQVHYLGKARGVEGQAAQTLALDPFDYPIDRIEVGREYYVKADIYFTAIGLIDIPTEDEIKSLMAITKANPQEYRLTA